MSYLNRTNTYTLSGTLSGLLSYVTSDGVSAQWGLPSFTIYVGGLVRFVLTSSAAGAPIEPGSEFLQYTLEMEWLDSLIEPVPAYINEGPHSQTYIGDGTFPPDGGPSAYGLRMLTGSWSVTVECNEFVDVLGGSQVADPTKCGTMPANIELDFSMIPVVGSTVTAICTFGCLTVNDTAEVSGVVPEATFVPGYSILVGTGVYGAPSYMSATWSLGDVTAPAAQGSYSDSYSSAVWGSTVSTSTTGDIGGGSVQYDITGLQSYDMQGRVQAWSDAYPEDILVNIQTGTISGTGGTPRIVQVTATGGTFSQTFTQSVYSIVVHSAGTEVVNTSYSDGGLIYAWVDPDGLTSLGEDPDLGELSGVQQRMWMRGWNWSAATISQASSLTAFTGSWDATGTAGSITVSASSFDAHLLGSVWSGASLAGYAFADVYLTADDDNQPARIHLGSKYWDVMVNTSGTVRIDLNYPTSATTAVDLTDTQWPWSGPDSGPLIAQSSDLSGVRNAASLVIDTLADGHTYTLTQLTLVRTDHCSLTFCDAFKSWKQAYDASTVGDVTTTTYYRRARQGDTDGEQSLESTDWVWVHTDDGGGVTSDTITAVAIKDVVTSLHSDTSLPRDGWDATDLLPNPDDGGNLVFNDLLNSDLPSCLLLGSGIWYDGKFWRNGFDLKAGNTLPAQYLFNSIQAYAGAGDVWNWSGGNFGGAVKLRPAIILRSGVWGTIGNSTSGSAGRDIGTKITVTESSVSDGGAKTGVVGEYKTGLPYVRGLHTATITALFASDPNGSTAFATRRRQRCSFDGPLTPPLCCTVIFCPDDFYFPFMIQAGDHDRLPLDDWQQIADVSDPTQSESDDDDQSDTSPDGDTTLVGSGAGG